MIWRVHWVGLCSNRSSRLTHDTSSVILPIFFDDLFVIFSRMSFKYDLFCFICWWFFIDWQVYLVNLFNLSIFIFHVLFCFLLFLYFLIFLYALIICPFKINYSLINTSLFRFIVKLFFVNCSLICIFLLLFYRLFILIIFKFIIFRSVVW